MGEFLQTLFLGLYGLAFGAGLLGFVYWRHGEIWRKVEAVYPGRNPNPGRNYHLETILFVKSPILFFSHRGLVTVNLGETGVSFKILPPISLIQKPIFVPYSDLRIYGDNWMLMGRVCWLEFKGLPGVRMIVPGKPGDMLLERADPYYAPRRDGEVSTAL